MVNYARWRKVDPEAALRSANRRFRRRFAQVESMAREQGQELATMSLEEMDRLWDQAKRA
jgi:tetrapyrrole methylase family protein/MazG family protein